MELGGNILTQTAGHPHETQHIQRHKGHIKTNDPEPESPLVPFFIQGETCRFREPVGHTSHTAEHHPADNHIMEVGNQEQTVVQNEVSSRNGQQDPGHPPYGERDDKAYCP